MIRNYFKIALRNLLKHRVYSLINVGGLAIGLAVTLLISMFVLHEYSYDRHHPDADRLYTVWGTIKFGEQEINSPKMSAAVGPAVKQHLPGVEAYVRLWNNGSHTLRSDYDHVFEENGFYLADASFFEIFHFPFVQGNARTALSQPMQVVISEQIAQKYFGKKDVVGQRLTFDNKLVFTITGVLQDAPSNATIRPSFVANMESLRAVEKLSPWYDPTEAPSDLDNPKVQLGSFDVYFKVKDASAAAAIPAKIQALEKSQNPDRNDKDRSRFFVQPLLNLHVGGMNFGDTSNTQLIPIFSWVALLVLALALVNYMSLTTARATLRAKEVGVRKASGATRSSLIRQFYVESAVLTSMAFGIALIVFELCRPAFLNLLSLRIDRSFVYSPTFVGAGIALLLTCVLVAGSYPALLLSGFRPIAVLKGHLSGHSGGIQVRRVLTVLQFAVSVALIFCSITIQHQLEYFRTKDTGLQTSQVLGIGFGSGMTKQIGAFQEGIRQITGATELPMSSTGVLQEGYSMFFTKSPINQKELGLITMSVNQSFLSFFGLRWKLPPSDPTRIGAPNTLIVNESAATQIGLTARRPEAKLSIGNEQPTVLGVYQNVNYASLRQTIEPMSLFVLKDVTPENTTSGGYFYVRLQPSQDPKRLLTQLEALHKRFNPQTPFSYYFLDDAFDKMYKTEIRLAQMFGIFTTLAILIACLGLFGLATFMAEVRTKEIGIRKVLGASAASIAALLSRDFLRLVVVAIVVACPVAYYCMEKWLQDFAYRTSINWGFFGLTALVAIATAVLAVSYQSIRAAKANPVKSLKTE
jgi:putative ABC transport system permease protein